MKFSLRTAAVAVVVGSSLALAGCSTASPAPTPLATEATERAAKSHAGTRICVLNNAGSVEVDAWHNELSTAPFSGQGGAIAPGEQRCFSGKQSFLDKKFGDFKVDIRVDVFIGSTPDIITFTGHTPDFESRNWGLAWTMNPNDEMGELNNVYASEAQDGSIAGHTFTFGRGAGLSWGLDILLTITS